MRHKLLFVGDIVLESEPEFSTVLRELFAEQAICCGNIEAPLRGKGQPIEKTGPVLNQRADAAHLLRRCGFNLFTMANNHICDYGDEGLFETIKAVGEGNTIGVGEKEKGYAMVIRTLDGIRYGFLAYGENGYGALNGERTAGYAWINAPRVPSDIASYREQVDMLIVQVHAGVEMIDAPIPEWRTRYQELIDCGADVVIGHHPHVVQGMEHYRGKPIFYSLGNFYFDGIADTEDWNTGGVLQLEVENGQLDSFHFYTVKKNGKLLDVMPAQATEELLEKRNTLLNDTAAYLEYMDVTAVEQWHKYHANYYAKAFNGLSNYGLRSLLKHIKRLLFNRKTDYNMLWHNLRIESNLWIVQRAIQRLHQKK